MAARDLCGQHAYKNGTFLVENRSPSRPHTRQASAERWLLLLFLLSLALLNPWVRGDGVGYYAFARAPLIEHTFDFERDYISANTGFREARLDANGQPKEFFRTRTGHLDNHFTVGPAMLWAPFLLLAHGGVLLARALGSHVAADGFSAPYRLAMAFGTAFWGFLGLFLAYRLARQYTEDVWAFLATVAIWWASSLPVYMYFNPSWSHAHSAFAVSLFVFYWYRTREQRSVRQWLVLALIAGLMLNVYYPNAMLLMILVIEALHDYAAAFRSGAAGRAAVSQLLTRHFLFAAITLLCLLPTFVTRYIVYGNPLESGYVSMRNWAWRSPYFLAVLFSSEHGLFSWTPLLFLATVGLVLFRWRDPRVGTPLLEATLAFYIFIACYPDWAGISSFGNRFFVSLTPLFILGLSFFIERVSRLFRTQRAAVATASVVLAAFMLWNAEFMFQWGAHLIPSRGPISWSTMIRNQFTVAPQQLKHLLQNYLFHRHDLMRQIEDRDIEQLKKQSTP
ncbi:MAG: hypothetical protein JWO71_3386 [Candidatus Acidoferrum typicum]|nr:hypothetical protein [Candidatus Acidoferrum typicum]